MGVSAVTITSAVDFAAMIWTPNTADLETEPGAVLLLPGVAETRGVGPGWQHPDYQGEGDWMPLEGDLGIAAGIRFLMRWQCATSQSGLAEAPWGLWRDALTPITVEGHPEITHRYRVDPMEMILNGENSLVDLGPWFNVEVWMRR